MKQVSIAAYLFLFILLGLSNVFASDNQGYIIQSTQPAVPVENGSRALFNTADMRYERTPLNRLGGVFSIFSHSIWKYLQAEFVSARKETIILWEPL